MRRQPHPDTVGVDNGTPATWRTTHQEAQELYALADEYDWDRKFDAADRFRAMADKLMQGEDTPLPPF